jgi:hypothetical protein
MDLTLIGLVKRLTAEERQALVTEARGDVAEAEQRLQQATNVATAYRGHRDVLTAAIAQVVAEEQKAASGVVSLADKVREKIEAIADKPVDEVVAESKASSPTASE